MSRRIATKPRKKVVAKSAPVSFLTKSKVRAINNSFSENEMRMMTKRYLQKDPKTGQQETPAEMFARVAKALANIEKNYGRKQAFVDRIEREFFEVMASKEYTPAGRTITNAGAVTPVVANCIVLPVMDSLDDIFQVLKEAALLQQSGAGLGFDFSHLRPAMTPTKRTQGVSSGPVEFLRIYDTSFGIIKQQSRHGANMAMMSIDHPDILDFIRAKEVEGDIHNFNISVKATDDFMRAVTESSEEQWYCSWKDKKVKPRRVVRSGNGAVVDVEDVDITAKEIFDELIEYAWLNGEPGIVFIDEVNRTNPLPGLGAIDCSNPCGEQFLHHYDNCNLGSINLAAFVKGGKVDWPRLKKVTKTAIRMMDNVVDVFDFPVQKVTDLARKNRRIGLGVMGFADMLYQLDIPYNSPQGLASAERVMETITGTTHQMSAELAGEKGEFFNIGLSVFSRKYGGKHVPMRNAALTTVAPTGSISMMFNCSSGVEPQFALAYVKQDKDGHKYHYLNGYFESALTKHKLSKKRIKEVKEEVVKTGTIQHLEDLPEKLRRTFVVAMDISADDHMKMQAAFQKHVDNSISKTINFPNSATKEDVARGFITAWKLGCKSATVYRDGSRQVQILNIGDGKDIKSPAELGAKKKEQALLVSPPAKIGNGVRAKDRPEVMVGKTYRVRTGYGNMYVTINNDEEGRPFEVFATIGRTGGFFQEQSEGICRLISTALRAGVSVLDIIEQLKGIRGPMPQITERGTILSLPDAIGQILEEHVGKKEIPPISLFESEVTETAVLADSSTISITDQPKAVADFGYMPGCPECGAALRMAEGCVSCPGCGYNRCG